MGLLDGKKALVTGARKGIGRGIAVTLAREGADVGVNDIVDDQSTRQTAKMVTDLGRKATVHAADVSKLPEINRMVEEFVRQHGGIDILVNNASAISLTTTLATPAKKLDLMWDVNMRATFLMAQACIPHLLLAANPQILTLSPPLSMDAKWFAPHLAYTMSKYGMSMCTLGLAREFPEISVNCLWPRTTIATSAIEYNFPVEILNASRKPAIVADAAYQVLANNEGGGNFYIDEDVLRAAGMSDFGQYAVASDTPLFGDLFLD